MKSLSNKSLCSLLFLIYGFLQQTSATKPKFNDAADPLDFKGKDYYDELQYPDIKNEKQHYIRKPPGGLSTAKPVINNVSPDIEPVNNFVMEKSLIKVGRIQGKKLEKTRNLPVKGNKFEVKTDGFERTIKGLEIDLKNVQHRGYQAGMRYENKKYIVTVQSGSPMSGTANVKFYVNPPWKKVENNGKNKKVKGTKKVKKGKKKQ